MQAINSDYPNTEECFAAFLQEHLKGDQDPHLEKLLEALGSVTVERHDIADDLKKMIEEGQVW